MSALILISVFIVATCGIVYELLAGTLASYLLGDSVLQFSTCIGTYMFALGIGSWISKFFSDKLSLHFIRLQIAIGLIGGLSASILFICFGYTSPSAFRVVLYLLVIIIGTLCGLEIPLLLRILQDQLNFKDLVSNVLALDYVGSLIASVLFPLYLVPRLGLVRTACLFGIINVLVAIGFIKLFEIKKSESFMQITKACFALLVLAAAFYGANYITSISEESLYSDNIIMTRQSPYQRLVITKHRDDIRLYLNNNLQFSSQDEFRYHEALVYPALKSAEHPRKVLILGGGDGLAAREILKNPEVESITLVDLDPLMTDLFSKHTLLTQLNNNSLSSEKLKIINDDAFVWLGGCQEKFDTIIVDFPDPNNFSVGKLYTTVFYNRLKQHLSPNGACVIQCTSPMFARRSFWCIVKTIASSGFYTRPYHVYVPSFGEWGYCLATLRPVDIPECEGDRFLTKEETRHMFSFPRDLAQLPTEVNKLQNQILVRYYDNEWQAIAE